jgi:predicted N-acetyltransferase YhbS
MTGAASGAAGGASSPASEEARLRFEGQEDGSTRVELELQHEARTVSRLRIIPYTIRVGVAEVRMDGIGDVATDRDFRQRGYARRMLIGAVAHMKRGQAAISMLYGIPNFYPKFGYATAGPDHLIHLLEIGGEVSVPSGWTVRPFVPTDLPALQRLYEWNVAHAVGSAAREVSSAVWSKLTPAPGPTGVEGASPPVEACRVVVAPDGRLAAYAWRRGTDVWYAEWMEREDSEAAVFAEVMADGPTAADAVLAVCRAWTAEEAAERSQPLKRATLGLPPEGPVASAAMLQDAQLERRYAASGGSMVRVLDQGRLLRALAPELSRRVRAAGVRRTARLTLETEEGAATLFITPEGVTVLDGDAEGADEILRVRLPQPVMGQLALGAYPPEDLLARLEAPPSGEARELLQVLFPLRSPHMHFPDRY